MVPICPPNRARAASCPPFGAHALHQTSVTTYEEMDALCVKKRLSERRQHGGAASPQTRRLPLGLAEVAGWSSRPPTLPAAGFAFTV